MLLIHFKKVIQKLAEAPGDLIGNKIADKITSNPKTSQQRDVKSMEIPKERDVSPE